jgi:hypothetical protein
VRVLHSPFWSRPYRAQSLLLPRSKLFRRRCLWSGGQREISQPAGAKLLAALTCHTSCRFLRWVTTCRRHRHRTEHCVSIECAPQATAHHILKPDLTPTLYIAGFTGFAGLGLGGAAAGDHRGQGLGFGASQAPELVVAPAVAYHMRAMPSASRFSAGRWCSCISQRLTAAHRTCAAPWSSRCSRCGSCELSSGRS